MPTILELFRGSTFDTDVDSKSQEGKGTLFSQVKSFGEHSFLPRNFPPTIFKDCAPSFFYSSF